MVPPPQPNPSDSQSVCSHIYIGGDSALFGRDIVNSTARPQTPANFLGVPLARARILFSGCDLFEPVGGYSWIDPVAPLGTPIHTCCLVRKNLCANSEFTNMESTDPRSRTVSNSVKRTCSRPIILTCFDTMHALG